MKPSEVAVVDYGVGNLFSVRRALEQCGADVRVTSVPEEIFAADAVVLPGVGAFADAMAELSIRRLDAVVREVAVRGTPLLGICLGMQMLFDESEEFGLTAGLGLIPGRVQAVPDRTSAGELLKIPHIGWSSLLPVSSREAWTNSILDGLQPGDATYFVHSFMGLPVSSEHRLADCVYGDVAISAVVQRGNVFGCQFHPEKSGHVGLRVLGNLIRMSQLSTT